MQRLTAHCCSGREQSAGEQVPRTEHHSVAGVAPRTLGTGHGRVRGDWFGQDTRLHLARADPRLATELVQKQLWTPRTRALSHARARTTSGC